jgi:hypothetical protein
MVTSLLGGLKVRSIAVFFWVIFLFKDAHAHMSK